jgi:galactofuranose transport system permease protein
MTLAAPHKPLWQSFLPSRQRLPFITTCLTFLTLYIAASLRYEHFFSLQVAVNFLSNNAFLGIAALGMTFVILAGGIDLSVGSVIAATSVFLAVAMKQPEAVEGAVGGAKAWGWSPYLAILVVMLLGTLLGLAHGVLIHFFALPPFLVTLGGLFAARGVGLLLSNESISIENPLYTYLSEKRFPLGPESASWSATIGYPALLFLALLIVTIYIAAYRPLGRNIYALGGSEQSALLMGLPVARTKIFVYAFSGFCAAFAGVVSTIASPSGDALRASGLELDAIAAVVVGGTLLTGGVGGPLGTLLGLLIFAVIQEAITFEGTLSDWWSKIAIGTLLLAFVLLQKLLAPRPATAAAH